MAWAVGLPVDTTKVRFIPGIITANNAAIQGVLSATNLATPTPYITTGFPMYFYSDTPPIGWTVVAAPADCLLALKGGASAYNVAGGALVGTWVGPGHALIQAEFPAMTVKNPQNGGGLALLINTPFVAGAAHSHDWSTTRPTAALGILASKNA